MWCICIPCTSYSFLFSISPRTIHSHLISDIKRVLLKKPWYCKGKRFFTISLLSSNRNNRLDQSTTWREGRASSPDTKVPFVVVRSRVNQKNVIIDNDNHEYRIRDKLINWLLGLPVEFAGLNSTAFFFTEPQTCYRTLMAYAMSHWVKTSSNFELTSGFRWNKGLARGE